MTNNSATRRVMRLGALFLIGDGILGVIGLFVPRCNSLVWHFGPELAKAATEELTAHRSAARFVYLAEAAAGVALASMLTPGVD